MVDSDEGSHFYEIHNVVKVLNRRKKAAFKYLLLIGQNLLYDCIPKLTFFL